MDNRPIGIFDSGLGGLTVLKELQRELPREDFVYLGDTARVPYGNRSKETIIEFSLEDARFLIKKDVKCIVVACNTASSYALDALKSEIDIPIFNVVSSGSKLAIKTTKNKKIGLIGTRATIKSNSFFDYIKSMDSEIEILQEPAPLLVPVIEEGEFELLDILLKKYLQPFKDSQIDTIILGCTHYPIISNKISKILGKNVEVINPGVELATELSSYLINYGKSADKMSVDGKTTYYVTDLNENFLKVAKTFIGHDLLGKIQKVEL